jgi:hypothetical protein
VLSGYSILDDILRFPGVSASQKNIPGVRETRISGNFPIVKEPAVVMKEQVTPAGSSGRLLDFFNLLRTVVTR